MLKPQKYFHLNIKQFNKRFRFRQDKAIARKQFFSLCHRSKLSESKKIKTSTCAKTLTTPRQAHTIVYEWTRKSNELKHSKGGNGMERVCEWKKEEKCGKNMKVERNFFHFHI